MDYELAKELNDAGYPQDPGLLRALPDKKEYGWFICEGRGDAFIDKELVSGSGAFRDELWQSYSPFQEAVYVPTLEELIEACGERYYSMVRVRQNDWRCYIEGERGMPKEGGVGKSAVEAVARLWLALNKKV